MSTTSESIEALSGPLKLGPSSTKKITAALRAKRAEKTSRPLWPASGKGGGKAAEHVDSWELKNVFLGAAALLPVDAAEAWAALDGLTCDGVTLGEALEELIEALSDEKIADNMMRERGETWQLRLCLDPCVAGVSWMIRGQPRVQVFQPTTIESLPTLTQLRRETTIPLAPFFVAGRLWRDTKRLRHDLMLESEPEAKRKGADRAGVGSTDRSAPGTPAHPKGGLRRSHAQNAISGFPEQAPKAPRGRAGHSSISTGSYDDAGTQPELQR